MSSRRLLAHGFYLCHYAQVVTRKKTLTVQELARMGGEARAKKLTAQQRKESARKAVQARWAKSKKKTNPLQ